MAAPMFCHSFSHLRFKERAPFLDVDRLGFDHDGDVAGTVPDYHSYSQSAQASLCPRVLCPLMGGMVDDGRPLCGIHSGHYPLLKIFPVITIWEMEKRERKKGWE